MSNELKAALDAARAAAEVIRGFYQRNVKIEVKADKTPVTEADVRSEEAIRDLLTKRFPVVRFLRRGNRQVRHGRRERLAGRSHRRHQVLRARVPVLLHADRADARWADSCWACRCAPAYDELAWAERGSGAFLNGKPIRVSKVNDAGRGDRFHRQSQDAGGVAGVGAFRRIDRAASIASAAMAISCTTTCWRAARSTWSSSPT